MTRTRCFLLVMAVVVGAGAALARAEEKAPPRPPYLDPGTKRAKRHKERVIPSKAHGRAYDSPELERGELLYDAPDGRVVAVVLGTAPHAALPGAPAGWEKVELAGPLGFETLYRRSPVPSQ